MATQLEPDLALERVLDLVRGDNPDRERSFQLVMQWPSLAAALAELLAAYELPVPRPWRRAADLVREER